MTVWAFAGILSSRLHRETAKDRNILVANDVTDGDTCNVIGGDTNVV